MLASFSTLLPQILTTSHGQGLSPSSQTPVSQTRYSALPQVSRIGFIARDSANASHSFPCQRRRLANTCRSLSGSAHSPPHLLRASNQIVGFVFYAQALASHLLCRSGNPTFGPLFASSPIESLFPAAVSPIFGAFSSLNFYLIPFHHLAEVGFRGPKGAPKQVRGMETFDLESSKTPAPSIELSLVELLPP